MEKLKEAAPIAIFVLPALFYAIAITCLAVFAPVAFCDSLDPAVNPIMDGYGGRMLRTLFVQCRVVP